MRGRNVLVLLACGLAAGSACLPSDPVLVLTPLCEPGAAQGCYCSARQTGAQTCSDDGMRWGACDCSVAPPSPPPPAQSGAPGATPSAKVTITRSDNIAALPGSVLFENSHATRGVVLLHGEQGGATVDVDAEPLARRGFTVLAMCWYGCAGRPSKILRVPLESVVEALGWLQQRVPSRRVGLFGKGRGAELAVLLASLLQKQDLVSAVAVHAPSDFVVGGYDPATPKSKLFEQGPGGEQIIAPAWTWQGSALAGSDNDSGVVERIEIERYLGPLWLSHGMQDELWSVRRSERLFARRQQVPSLVTLTQFWPGEKHVLSASVAAAFIDGLSGFFEAQMAP
ncbi:MAG: hypothetical protein KC503_20775 [Myxococcales bacterium]|nr:hypothetical protein [Myxococcales bacterium]